MSTSKNRYFLVNLLLCVFLSSCMGLKHLQEDEKLLARQTIKAPNNIDREQVKNLYAQKTNRTILRTGMKPLVALYYGVWGTQSYKQEKYVLKREKVEKKFDAKIANTT